MGGRAPQQQAVSDQLAFFDTAPTFPEGFKYAPDVLSRDEERSLLQQIEKLPFRDFEFHGYTGKRRVVSYGWHYDFKERRLGEAEEPPSFLLDLRKTAAPVANMAPERLQQVLVTEYAPGAGIGWHRDKAVFGEVIGISLLSPCLFRLRRSAGESWERVSLTAEARSVYVLSGPARTEWEHSIPPVDMLRYSVTFRNLRDSART